MSEAKWYVVHTYSGYENKVKANIDKTIENRHLEDQILEVRVPMQDVVELKNGVQKATQKKMFPGYVLIHMIMNDDTWYVVHTYSGYENKVKANIDKTIENRHLEDQILEVRVPMEDVEEMKNGQKKLVQKKMFPGYVLINMVMNDDTWYVVRNTRGVTGFVGPGSKPVPLTEEEMDRLGIQNVTLQIDFEEGDSVVVTGGVWKDTVGVVQSINEAKQIVTINVELFGRETPVEISFAEVKKM